LAACGGAALTGCAVGPNYRQPAPPPVTRYTSGPQPQTTQAVNAIDGQAQVLQAGRDIAGEWWGLFRSPRLSALIATALRQNPSLQAAQQTLRQAEETTLAAEGSWLPQVSGALSRQREKFSPAQSGLSPATRGATVIPAFSVYAAQLSVSYTFDIWGQTRRTVEADAAQAEYQRSELEGAVTMLAANTATAVINAAALQAEIEAEEKLIGAERDLLRVVRQQFELGGATGADVATQEAQLGNTEALVVPLRTQLAQMRDQLAAYLGRVPSDADIPAVALNELTLPGEVPVSLPSQLVAQRPDIRASAAQLHAATAQVGVAIANRLPQLTLSAFVGSAPSQIGDLFTPGNGFWSITNQLAGPLFEGGTLLHQQRAAVAAMKAAAANYQSTVIGAFQNVADALTALSNDASALQANQDAERAAARSLSLAQLQYREGGVSYLTVLTAQTQYQNAVINLIRARAARYTDTVALLTALGGGWWNRNDIAPPPQGIVRSLLP
jgi:NodT family efflux transporter outer membrane factor (OMF) lipoprotein